MRIKEYAKRPEFISAGIAILLYLAAGIVFFVNFGSLPSEDLVLRFNAAEGVKTLGSRLDIVLIFLAAGCIIAGNLFLAKELFYKERALAMLFVWGSGLVALFTLVVMGLVVSIN